MSALGGWVCVCGARANGPINAPGPRQTHQTLCDEWNAYRVGRLVRLLLDRAERANYGHFPELRARWRAQLDIHTERLSDELVAR